MSLNCGQNLLKFYLSVVDDVIRDVKDDFLDEGVDDQVLQELRQSWEEKLKNAKSVDTGRGLAQELAPQRSAAAYARQSKQQQQVRQAPVQTHVVSQPPPVRPQQQTIATLVPAAALPGPHATHPSGAVASATAALPQQTNIIAAASGIPPGYQLVQGPGGQFILNLAPANLPPAPPPPVNSLPQGQGQPHQQAYIIQPAAGSNLPQQVIMTTANPQPQGVMQLDGATDREPSSSSSGAAGASRVDLETLLRHAQEEAGSSSGVDGACGVDAQKLPRSKGKGKRLLKKPRRPVLVTGALAVRGDGTSVLQLDGPGDSSSDESDDLAPHPSPPAAEYEDEDGNGRDEDPLNSGDDISDEDPQTLFETDNVVVCQFDKINRNKNKWKFHLKDGIMHLQGHDYIFQKANGEAEW